MRHQRKYVYLNKVSNYGMSCKYWFVRSYIPLAINQSEQKILKLICKAMAKVTKFSMKIALYI